MQLTKAFTEGNRCMYKEEVEELHTHTHSTVQYMQWTAEETHTHNLSLPPQTQIWYIIEA